MLNFLRRHWMNLIAKLTSKINQVFFPERKVMTGVLLASLPGVIVLLTEDGNSIIISAEAARNVHKQLPQSIAIAVQAKSQKNATLN